MHHKDEAGRAAYLAGFHAAQALISERTGRVAKTHDGFDRVSFTAFKDAQGRQLRGAGEGEP